MSAQKTWKHFYRQIVDGMIVSEYIPDQRNDMLRYRREAALERKLEAANRRIVELELEIYDNQEHADRLMEVKKENADEMYMTFFYGCR